MRGTETSTTPSFFFFLPSPDKVDEKVVKKKKKKNEKKKNEKKQNRWTPIRELAKNAILQTTERKTFLAATSASTMQ